MDVNREFGSQPAKAHSDEPAGVDRGGSSGRHLLGGLASARARLIGACVVVVALAFGSLSLAASLTPSTFNAGDGNLSVEGTETDWVSAAANKPPFSSVEDKVNGTGDNAFGNGTSEDQEVPSLVTDSIPPNKSDITRFLQYNETLGTGVDAKTFLYLAWERISDPSGSTNFDFELNKSKSISTNGVTPVRTAGDILVKYDLAQGGTTPVLGYHVWLGALTSGTASKICEANAKFPCWGKAQPIAGANFQASINAGTVTDPIPPGGPRTLSARTFGEAAINLTGAGILPASTAGVCTGFAQAYLKSRSSDSFNAAMKDFAAPLPSNISNCKPTTIRIKKVDLGGQPLAGAVMQLFKDTNGTAGLQASDTQIDSDCTTDATGFCPDFVIAAIAANSGTYIAHEKTAPAGYLNTAPDQTRVVAIDDETHIFTLTFSDSPAPGKINIHKVDDSTPAKPLKDVVFQLYARSGSVRTMADLPINGKTCTTNAAGDCSINDVALGDYWVVEVAAPNGYTKAADKPVTIGLGGSPEVGDEKNLTFVDPVVLGTVKVIKFDDSGQALGGAVFTLIDGNAATTDPTCTTDAAGKCQFDNVALGTYTLRETTTPNGHVTAADKTVTVDLGPAPGAGDVEERTFVDVVVLGTVKVIKVDDSGKALAGAVFTLIDGSAATTDPTCTTDAAGKCQFDNVALGTYTLRETTTPNGHVTAADKTVTVDLGSAAGVGDVETRTFTDVVVLGTVKVIKVDDSGNALAGAVFTLIDGNAATTDPTCTTDAIGKCQFVNVALGTYTLRETTTPDGHATAADKSVTIELGPAPGVGDVESRSFIDPVVLGTIKITKVDDAGTALKGAVFTLIDGVSATTDPTCTTDAAGKCQFDNVPLGTYTVSETTTPPGYDTAEDKIVTIGLGSAPGVGDVESRTFVDPRRHRVIVVVCHEGSHTLAPSDVKIGATTKQSLDGTGMSAADQAALCATGGASFGSISEHPTLMPEVTVGKVGGVPHG